MPIVCSPRTPRPSASYILYPASSSVKGRTITLLLAPVSRLRDGALGNGKGDLRNASCRCLIPTPGSFPCASSVPTRSFSDSVRPCWILKTSPQGFSHKFPESFAPTISFPTVCKKMVLTAVARELQCDSLHRVPQVRLRIATGASRRKTIKSRPAHFRQRAHALHRQGFGSISLALDLAIDSGFPIMACSCRCCLMRCKHPFKKSISSVC